MSQGAGTLKRVLKPVTDHAYINHQAGFACPWCASPNVTLSGTDFTFGGDFIGQQTSCDDCAEKWQTIYTLSGYST